MYRRENKNKRGKEVKSALREFTDQKKPHDKLPEEEVEILKEMLMFSETEVGRRKDGKL